ncbi:MFS transporter [Clostridium guangxiense]|uniref:MFS transporter n=1 Tax=Clostridium guangxiense TaxID=1662055 RepID=UPI001E4FF586|nr:MFS transporter [Clostridium guangxiense]MCD2345498.1 MHS family MFS transporter [Clostridium guangxiense]
MQKNGNDTYEIETKELVKVAASGWLGTAMEFMDFQLYSLAAAIVFNKVFFPNASPAIGLIMSMGTYGAGYIARLVGAYIFGRIGDKVGRRAVLFITITLMGLTSTLIGFLPTYQKVGILAPIGLVILRIFQGLGAGAEISGAGVMVAEFSKVKNRGLIGSLVCLGTSSGTLLANLIWTVILTNINEKDLFAWGWRIPFFASFIVMIAAILIRIFVKESPVMAEKKKLLLEERQEIGKNGKSVEADRKGKKSFLVALGLRFGQAGNSGILQTYLAGFVVTVLLMQKTIATDANIISSLVSFITIPVVGYLGDKFGRRKIYMILSLAMAVYSIPMMMLINSKNVVLLTIALVIGLNVGCQGIFALENVMLSELFGSKNRVTLVSLAKEVAGVIATGFGPLIAASWVSAMSGSWIPVAIMLIIFSLSTFFSSYVSEDVTGRDLNDLDDAM